LSNSSKTRSKRTSKKIRKNNKIIFDIKQFIAENIFSLCILITFGAIFPTIAVVVCIAMVRNTYFKQVLVARMLIEATEEDCFECAELLMENLIDTRKALFAAFEFDDDSFWLFFSAPFILDIFEDDKFAVYLAFLFVPLLLNFI
jgi:hypothetical protein